MYKFENEKFNVRLAECLKQYEQYRQVINDQIDYSNPHAIVKRLEILNAHNAYIPKLRAEFDFFVEQASAVEMRKILEDMPAKKFETIIKSSVGTISLFAKSLEGLLKEAHYQIESMRSVLSFHKQEMSSL